MSASIPFTRLDHVLIAVRDLAAAERSYAALLGLPPSWRGTDARLGTEMVRFELRRGAIALAAPAVGTPPHPLAAALRAYLERRAEGPFALAFATDDFAASTAWLRARGLSVSDVTVREHLAGDRSELIGFVWRKDARGVNVIAVESEAPPATSQPTAPASAASAIDHVVLFTDDLDGALRLWRDTFAIAERWRREFPERGTVNVGLRIAAVTVELVAPLSPVAGERGERLWGIAYAVGDCEAAVSRVRAEGIPVSDTRSGLAPGTRVATVKWPDGVPSLLLEYAR